MSNEKINQIIEKEKIRLQKRKEKHYDSCLQLTRKMEHIINNPIDSRTYIHKINNPNSSYTYYSTQCSEFQDLIRSATAKNNNIDVEYTGFVDKVNVDIDVYKNKLTYRLH